MTDPTAKPPGRLTITITYHAPPSAASRTWRMQRGTCVDTHTRREISRSRLASWKRSWLRLWRT